MLNKCSFNISNFVMFVQKQMIDKIFLDMYVNAFFATRLCQNS